MFVGDFLRRSTLLNSLRRLPSFRRGFATATQWAAVNSAETSGKRKPNPLRVYFDSIEEGRGIWKWDHYFDVYHRHLAKFVGRDCHIAEIGVYSGGSLSMWHSYFGSLCRVYGIDCQEACKEYEDDRTKILIGDQADRGFWRSFREQVPQLDVLIDDGGHLPEQQIITLEETLPYLRPGGVYICEDVTGEYNQYAAYISGFSTALNAFDLVAESVVRANALQRSIASIHFYPFVTVIEKRCTKVVEFRAPKRGRDWQPFKLGETFRREK